MTTAMDTATLLALLMACAPQIHAGTAHALVSVESAANPYAIGVVGGALVRQPTTRAEAIATARALQTQGWDFSVGLAQINQRNFVRLGLTVESAFEPCANLRAMQTVLVECFDRATPHAPTDAAALRNALSCYYSGNFSTGLRHGYVRKVLAAAAPPRPTLPPASIPATTTKECS
jgi:type IV secretion system protein VirB1